ncbi:hypothetical protein [Shimia aestuarii]|uniref:Uncharacterized protein n=1 Tax=Shimia aestuarii TaxID=254406 RepID=A0A1I4HRH9_9RHOB|nr:hypothetical protein [Shimia aestuarii]SFL44742.1 hypothetical protein SAMN04488042_101233 [Shimia aestuarii]
MAKFPCPYVAKGSRALTRTAFNEGVQVPNAEFDKLAAKNPALKSKNRQERSEALKKEILTGELQKYRVR